MTTPVPVSPFAGPAPAHRLERAATALTAHGFAVEILDDAAAARARVRDLIPEGASVFTGASETASATGSQLPSYAGGAGHRIWIAGAQKVVPDLPAALRRVEEHSLPLETARARVAYGKPSAINRLLILNAEPDPGQGTVLLLRQAIGF